MNDDQDPGQASSRRRRGGDHRLETAPARL